jgi:hypothetical protein
VTLTPVALTIGSTTIDLDQVIADVTIRHGRVDVYEAASPSTLQLTIEDVPRSFTRAFRVGSPLVFTCTDGVTVAPRFTGTVTDGAVDDSRLTAIAVGRLASLASHTIGGTVDYPAEAWSARVTRAFTEAGLSAYLQLVAPAAGADPSLAVRTVIDDGPVGLDEYLSALADMVGAAVADTPDGKILVQPISSRTLAGSVVLDPDLVAYVPVWTQVLPLANVVTVKYVGGEVTVQDAASVAFYGVRPVTIETTFTSPTAAAARANDRLARSAYSHWNIPSAPYLVGARLGIGAPLTLSDMPASSPYATWTPVLEGWQDNITGDGHELDWTMELALSDPLASGLTLPWNQVPTTPGYTWATINQTVPWHDALQLGDLEP